jgi:hypothetical protein
MSASVGRWVSSSPNTLPPTDRSMPGAERLAGAGHHDSADGIVCARPVEGVLELVRHPHGERVHLVGALSVSVRMPSRTCQSSVSKSTATSLI